MIKSEISSTEFWKWFYGSYFQLKKSYQQKCAAITALKLRQNETFFTFLQSVHRITPKRWQPCWWYIHCLCSCQFWCFLEKNKQKIIIKRRVMFCNADCILQCCYKNIQAFDIYLGSVRISFLAFSSHVVWLLEYWTI